MRYLPPRPASLYFDRWYSHRVQYLHTSTFLDCHFPNDASSFLVYFHKIWECLFGVEMEGITFPMKWRDVKVLHIDGL